MTDELPLVTGEADWRKFAETLLPQEGRRDSLVGLIVETVGLDILTGKLYPGCQINSVDLSERFNTSRTPVREALLLLEKEGLIIIPPRRRPQVATILLNEILEIYHIRELLLVDAVDQVVSRASDEELADLVEISKAMEEKIEEGAVAQAFLDLVLFHDGIVKLSRNETLRKILDRLRLQTSRVRYAVFTLPGEAMHTVRAHRQLAEALAARDVPIAKGFVQSILQQARGRVARGEVSLVHADDAEPKRRRRKRVAKEQLATG